MMAKALQSHEAAGGKGIVTATCEWSTRESQFFGVEEYPSIKALKEHVSLQREMGFTAHLGETFSVGTSRRDDGDWASLKAAAATTP